MMKKIFNFLFPEMSLQYRVYLWCNHIHKDISYGKNITHEYLDKVVFPKIFTNK